MIVPGSGQTLLSVEFNFSRVLIILTSCSTRPNGS
jgi:hypothetical protein